MQLQKVKKENLLKEDLTTCSFINFEELTKIDKIIKIENSENFSNFFDFEDEDFEIINYLLFLINNAFEISFCDSIFNDFSSENEESSFEIENEMDYSFCKKSEKFLENILCLKKKKNWDSFLSIFDKKNSYNFDRKDKFYPERFLDLSKSKKKFKYY